MGVGCAMVANWCKDSRDRGRLESTRLGLTSSGAQTLTTEEFWQQSPLGLGLGRWVPNCTTSALEEEPCFEVQTVFCPVLWVFHGAQCDWRSV